MIKLPWKASRPGTDANRDERMLWRYTNPDDLIEVAEAINEARDAHIEKQSDWIARELGDVEVVAYKPPRDLTYLDCLADPFRSDPASRWVNHTKSPWTPGTLPEPGELHRDTEGNLCRAWPVESFGRGL